MALVAAILKLPCGWRYLINRRRMISWRSALELMALTATVQ
jgi:hypothetical protein